MRKILLLILLFCCELEARGQSFNWEWAYSFGADQYDATEDVITDASGNVYISGTFSDTVDFDPGPGIYNLIADSTGSFFLIKLNSNGNLLWAHKWDQPTFFSASNQHHFILNIDANQNIIMTGYFSSTLDFDPGPGSYMITSAVGLEYFILKLDSSGNFVWARAFGGLYNTPQCYSKIGPFGTIYIAGHFVGNRDFDPGPGTFMMNASTRDIFMMRLDATGNFLWASKTSGNLNTWVSDIVLDTIGNLIITGSFSGTTDFDPSASSFNMTAGATVNVDHTYYAKYSPLGNFLWAKQIATNWHSPTSMTIDNNGNIFSVGSFLPPCDFDPGPGTHILTSGSAFLCKLNPVGDLVFAHPIGEGSYVDAYDIILDNYQNIYLTGNFYDTVDFDLDSIGTFYVSTDSFSIGLFLTQWDSACNFINAFGTGGIYQTGMSTPINKGFALFADPWNNVYLTGMFQDPELTIGNTTLYNATPQVYTYSDAFIAKIGSPTGIHEVQSEQMAVSGYPNPTDGYFTIKNNSYNYMELFNMNGALIMHRSILPGKIEMDFSEYPSGIYLYRLLKENGEVYSKRIIKY